MEPNWTVAPGDYLQEWIEDNALEVGEVAERLGLHCVFVLTYLLEARIPVTPALAVRLEQLTGVAAGVWLRYEESYREGLRAGKVRSV